MTPRLPQSDFHLYRVANPLCESRSHRVAESCRVAKKSGCESARREFQAKVLAFILFVVIAGSTLLFGSVGAQAQVVKSDSSAMQSRDRTLVLSPLSRQAQDYQAMHRRTLVASILWRFVGFFVILHLNILPRALRWLRSRTWVATIRRRNKIAGVSIEVVISFAIYSLYTVLWNLPIGFFSLGIERSFGFSHESAFSYLKDVALNFGVGLSYLFLLIPGYLAFEKFPKNWWLLAWAVVVPVSFVSAVIYPVAISPLFNSYLPMKPSPLRTQILEMANRAGIGGAEIYVEDTSKRTSHVNAYVIGIGPTTRIVLNDTALKELPEDQLLAMMGHEMGHYSEKHIWIGLTVGAVGSIFLLWVLSRCMEFALTKRGAAWGIDSMRDPGSIPLLFGCIYVLTLLGQPAGNAVSRIMEHRADIYGLRLTRLNDATARLFIGFAERDFSDPDPPKLLHLWFGTHPTLKERIDFAKSYREN